MTSNFVTFHIPSLTPTQAKEIRQIYANRGVEVNFDSDQELTFKYEGKVQDLMILERIILDRHKKLGIFCTVIDKSYY